MEKKSSSEDRILDSISSLEDIYSQLVLIWWFLGPLAWFFTHLGLFGAKLPNFPFKNLKKNNCHLILHICETLLKIVQQRVEFEKLEKNELKIWFRKQKVQKISFFA